MSEKHKIRVGSRKSELALIQTRHVISLLQGIHMEKEFEIITMSTLGDKVLDVPLPKIGEKSLFTRELEAALADSHVDFVVHSLKDLPTCLPNGMAIGAVLEREDPRDALVLQKDLKDVDLETLSQGSVIGTSSLRRAAQLRRKYPHLNIEDIRGNLNTRLRKLDELGKFQALILAAAGLQRMGWNKRITRIVESDELLYAVGQGALAIECRENDTATLDLLKPIFHLPTALRILAERSFLKTLGGGCSAPVAVCSDLRNVEGAKHTMDLTGAVWSLDGKEEILANISLAIDLQSKEKCPFKNNICKDGDNECTNKCTFKRESEDCERVAKKMKVSEPEKQSVPIELLQTDPHEQCPVSMPVGADFMGKCPYLENQAPEKHVNVDIEKSGGTLNISKCPFFKDVANTATSGSNSSQTNVVSKYCGLVPHPNLPIHIMDQVEKLGSDLAQLLIKKGAMDVMSKAQAHIRAS